MLQAFDGLYARALAGGGEGDAGAGWGVVDQYGAGAADAVLAAQVRAG
jgi:hypothetical protein